MPHCTAFIIGHFYDYKQWAIYLLVVAIYYGLVSGCGLRADVILTKQCSCHDSTVVARLYNTVAKAPRDCS